MQQNRVHIAAHMLDWARERSGRPDSFFTRKFPKYDAWHRGEVFPTLKQMENFAKATYTPIGYFFLSPPPEDKMPIPDFRAMGGELPRKPSPNLLDMIYICLQRQGWYQDYAQRMDESPRTFVGSASISDSVESVAKNIRDALNFDLNARLNCLTWTDALGFFVEQTDDLGILVLRSGVVGNNTHRPLNPQEFRGFALADSFAPLIFINSRDTKAAQMFTLAHELAHIWINQSALSDAGIRTFPDQKVEAWCNQVAAELLVPMHILNAEFSPEKDMMTEVQRLARFFKVSTLVILRRIFDSGKITKIAFHEAYDRELERLLSKIQTGRGGGDFYLTQAARVGKRFAHALVVSTLEGHTLYRDAMQMLGVKRVEAFNEIGRNVGVNI